jgi:hypothetical protein
MTVNNELERMWKEVVMAQFKVLSCHLPGQTKENYKKKLRIFRVLNWEPPRHRSEALLYQI